MSEAGDGDFFVFGCAAAFAGLGGGFCGVVGDGDMGGDFVAVLAARALGAAFGDGAVFEEFFGGDGGGMGLHCVDGMGEDEERDLNAEGAKVAEGAE